MNAVSAQPLAPDPAVTDAFRSAIGLVARGVTIITSGRGDHRRGLTATAVCSLSMWQPTILAYIKSMGAAHSIEREKFFAVNTPSRDDLQISDLVAGCGEGRSADEFQVGDWSEIATGAPMFGDTVLVIDCKVAEAGRPKLTRSFSDPQRDDWGVQGFAFALQPQSIAPSRLGEVGFGASGPGELF